MLNLMKMADVCAELGVSRRTVYRMVVSGELPQPHSMRNHRWVYFYRPAVELAVKRNLGLAGAKRSSGSER